MTWPRTNLTASIVKVGDYLNQRRDTLSDDLINQTESLLTQAQDLLNSTEGDTGESATDELTDMTALLESTYTTLQSYVPPTPTPAPYGSTCGDARARHNNLIHLQTEFETERHPDGKPLFY